MQFDPYHIFTVDEHTFQCIQKLHEIEAGTHAESAPLSYRLISALRNDDPHNHRQALYAALMLHDICKGRDGDHAALGAQLAQELCPLLGLDEERTRLAAWLVEHHLLLARTAAKRDPDDPRTVPQFCAPIPDATHLDLLVLLTTADTMGVGPGRWTPYMEGAATQLYNDARLFMTERALRKTPKADLPADYAAGEIRIAIHNDPKRQVTVVRVVAPDRAELAETLAGTLGLLDANIVDATMETTDENGLPSTAIDCFFIQTSGGLPYQEDFFDRIRAVLEDSLEKNDSAALARKLGVQMKRHTRFSAYPLDVSLLFNNQASARCTVLEVTTRDRPGLLYDLCRTFNELGLTLDRARIAYFGHKAEDTFYLRDAKTGQKIDPERFEAIAKHLADSPGLRIS